MHVIRNGRVIDPANGIDKKMHLVIERGRVERLIPAEETPPRDVEGFDAEGLVVAPGLVDIHVHLREPGQEYKEDIETGTLAAAAGGVTSVVAMANTNPVNDHAEVTRQMRERARKSGNANVYPTSAITKGLKGKELAAIAEQVEAGCVAITDDGYTVADAALLRRAMEYARGLDLCVMEHCEDPALACGHMHEGIFSMLRGIAGKPHASEDIIVARDIELAKLTGCHLHVQHVSSARSIELIRDAKARGIRVTAEVTPHHLWLTDEDVGYDTNFKMNPPLRTAVDREALRAALAEGVFDCIATDHAPHAIHEKQCEFDLAMPGIVGLETLLPLGMKLVRDKHLSLKKFVELVTIGPARALKLPAGTLSPGADADICVFDPNEKWVVDPEKLKSKSRNTPFGKWEVQGRVRRTYLRGRVVFEKPD